jgi:hypothetical protein
LAVATGNFNGDEYFDLAIGAPRHPSTYPGTHVGFGNVNVYYGSSAGLDGVQLWSQEGDVEGTPESGEEGTEVLGDRFGSSLAAGKFDSCPYYDLAIGVPGEDLTDVNDNPNPSDVGAMNVIYGSAGGLSPTETYTGSGARLDQFWQQNSPNIDDSAEPGDGFESSLASG